MARRVMAPSLPALPWKTIVNISLLMVLAGILFSSVSTVTTIYNTLVKSKVSVEQKLSDLESEYQRRYALIDNLVVIVKETKGFEQELMDFEKSVYIQTAEAKASATKLSLQQPVATTTRLKKEDALSQTLSQFVEKFLILAQHFPTIGDPVVKERTATIDALKDLNGTLMEIEENILSNRKAINETVRVYNQNQLIFPANAFAASWGFTKLEGFQVLNEQARQDATLQF